MDGLISAVSVLLLEQHNELLFLASYQLMIFAMGCWLFSPDNRNPSFFEQRLTWENYATRHNRRGTFKIRLRMSKQSFDKLLEYI